MEAAAKPLAPASHAGNLAREEEEVEEEKEVEGRDQSAALEHRRSRGNLKTEQQVNHQTAVTKLASTSATLLNMTKSTSVEESVDWGGL